MKILINSSDCVIDSNFEYNVRYNIDTSTFNSCILEYIDIPITWNNINSNNNAIQLIENNIMTDILLPDGQYLNFNQISSQLMISLNIYSVNKNYIVNYNQQTRKYTIKNNNIFSLKINYYLAKLLGLQDEYNNVTIAESYKICNLSYNNFYINIDFLQPEILTKNNSWYNFLVPIENINDNIVNKFSFKHQSNHINKTYCYLKTIKINFIDSDNHKVFPDTFILLLNLT